ncbi:MAG TPA: IniB N-terminal domain-containing protein [Sporichthyaceae bacterium]|jgi:hypothetical protein|nr:IniB N-terminal domain-containing protein [Sporichthyaceae bacterium]
MATSLLDWIMHLLQNPEAREQFQANPQAAMASAGMSSVCGQDVRDARAFLLDNPNVQQVGGGDKQDVRSDAGHDHIHHIINNYAYEPKHPVAAGVEQVAPVSGLEQMNHAGHYGRIDHIRADGTGNNHDHPVAVHHKVARPVDHHVVDDSHNHRLADRHDRYAHVDDAHNRWAHVDDSHDRHTWHEFGVGPTASGGTGGDQHDSRVAHDQLEMGGRGNLLGDDNDFSDRHSTNQTRTDTASRITTTSTSSDSHRHDDTVSGNGAAGHDVHRATVNGNGASGRDMHADHTNSHTNVSGNGSAGHDVHVDKNGPVMGQGMANGDIDHTGSLAGLDHTVSVGDINLLSGLVNTGDVLDGSLDHSLNHVVDHSPILNVLDGSLNRSPILNGSLNHVVDHSLNHSPILSGDTIPVLSPSLLSNDPILSGLLDHSPVLSGDLNNSLNHVLNGDLNHDLNGDLNHSLNHLGQGSLDDLLHNTDVHNIHDIVEHILG